MYVEIHAPMCVGNVRCCFGPPPSSICFETEYFRAYTIVFATRCPPHKENPLVAASAVASRMPPRGKREKSERKTHTVGEREKERKARERRTQRERERWGKKPNRN